MRLYVDVATSNRWNFSKDIPDEQQAHMVRLSWLMEEEDGETKAEGCHLIRLPKNERMAGAAAHNLGIYNHLLEERGVGMAAVLTEFAEQLGQARSVIAHNWQFKRKVLERSFRYVGMPDRTWPIPRCAMLSLTNIVKIPSDPPARGFKWPSFENCCEHFLNRQLVVSQDPVADGFERVRAVRLFWAAVRQQEKEE